MAVPESEIIPNGMVDPLPDHRRTGVPHAAATEPQRSLVGAGLGLSAAAAGHPAGPAAARQPPAAGPEPAAQLGTADPLHPVPGLPGLVDTALHAVVAAGSAAGNRAGRRDPAHPGLRRADPRPPRLTAAGAYPRPSARY